MLKLVKQLKIKFEGDDVPYPVTNFTKMQKYLSFIFSYELSELDEVSSKIL